MLPIIERHLQRTGIPATRFGLDAANDRSLVQGLRRGRELRPELERRLRAYIAATDATRIVRDPSLRMVRALAGRAGAPVELVDALCREWGSATFIGHRHIIRFMADAAAAARMCAGWEDGDFALVGHLVVDVTMTDRNGDMVTIDALTVVVA